MAFLSQQWLYLNKDWTYGILAGQAEVSTIIVVASAWQMARTSWMFHERVFYSEEARTYMRHALGRVVCIVLFVAMLCAYVTGLIWLIGAVAPMRQNGDLVIFAYLLSLPSLIVAIMVCGMVARLPARELPSMLDY